MTTNGKCKRCGSPPKKQKYWKQTINIMQLIYNNRIKGTPVQINEKIFFVPNDYFKEASLISGADWKDMAVLVERIRRDCTGYAY